MKEHPVSSTVVLARTKAEGRALSWLMRQRMLAQAPDTKRAVIEVSRDLDGRVTEPLEIAVGDRLRIGATQWEKQLFNGTVVTVEDIDVKRVEKAAVSRQARNRQATGRGSGADMDRAEPEFAVHITARTDDGRRVAFRHDEIRDWHDNIRLDYGYAMTIASAQGLTADRAFLLVDDRPARETIYPAATRHREALDVYVNRAPLAFDIAEHRSEDEADRPVLDSDVRAYLAERWSRSQPKEAALDYVSEGMWRDAREGAHLGRAESQGEHRFDLDGAAALVERIAAFTGSEALAAETRARLGEIVGEYRAHAAARDRVRGFLRDVERHWLRYHTITHRERERDVPRQEQRSWPIWLDRNERLLREGRAILDDPATYGPHLDRVEDGRERLGTEVSRLERFSSAYRTQSRSRDRGPTRSL